MIYSTSLRAGYIARIAADGSTVSDMSTTKLPPNLMPAIIQQANSNNMSSLPIPIGINREWPTLLYPPDFTVDEYQEVIDYLTYMKKRLYKSNETSQGQYLEMSEISDRSPIRTLPKIDK